VTLSNVQWIPVPHRTDDRGTLAVLERATVPFDLKRVFFMHRVPAGAERGGHAHPHTDQVVVSVAGSLRLALYDGADTSEYLVDDPHMALYVPRMIWTRLLDFSSGAVTMVLCNTAYVPADVIRDIDAYRARLGAATR
jgi:dTDP-4-dehydrorhamnose 3,5-epimerase-like enzyme